MGDVGMEPFVLKIVMIASAGDVTLMYTVGTLALIEGLDDTFLDHGRHVDGLVQRRWQGGQSRVGQVGVKGVAEGSMFKLKADSHRTEVLGESDRIGVAEKSREVRPGGIQGACVGVITDCHHRTSSRTKERRGTSEEAETSSRKVRRHAERAAVERGQASIEVGEGG